MSVSNFAELMDHVGHEVEVVHYGRVNVAVECETCGSVLFDFDAPEIEEIAAEHPQASVENFDPPQDKRAE